MKKTKKITLSVCIALFLGIIYLFATAFDPEYSNALIKQKIGGVLICNTVYNADHHSWQYDVDYKYRALNDSVYEIGNGTYYGREWNKDEQLIKFGKWIILKTGGWIGSDKIVIRDMKSKKWSEYVFSPENIEKENLWTSSNIHSLLNWCCTESFVTSIKEGEIEVLYKFRVDEHKTELLDSRKVIYSIDYETGKLKMSKIKS